MAKVFISTVIDAPAGRVWSVVRDFNGMGGWTSFVSESRIEQNEPSDKIGCIRNFTLKEGGKIRERLLALSDYDLSFTYEIVESGMGVENYVATLKLSPITDGDRCFAEWTAEFDCSPEREAELVNHVGKNVFLAALTSLKVRFGR